MRLERYYFPFENPCWLLQIIFLSFICLGWFPGVYSITFWGTEEKLPVLKFSGYLLLLFLKIGVFASVVLQLSRACPSYHDPLKTIKSGLHEHWPALSTLVGICHRILWTCAFPTFWKAGRRHNLDRGPQLSKGISHTMWHHALYIKLGKQGGRGVHLEWWCSPSHHYAWWSLAFLGIAEHPLDYGKWWINSLFFLTCVCSFCFLY